MQITHKPRHTLEQEIKDLEEKLKQEQCVGFYECVCYVLDKNERGNG